MTADGAAIERDMADAIATVLARHERSMPNRWLALIETIDEDGERGLWTLTSLGMMAWDTVGLLQYATHLQLARTISNGSEE